MPTHLHFIFCRCCCGFTILWLLKFCWDCQSCMHSCDASTKHRRLHGGESCDQSWPTNISPKPKSAECQKMNDKPPYQNNPWGIVVCGVGISRRWWGMVWVVVGGVWYKSSWVGYGISRRCLSPQQQKSKWGFIIKKSWRLLPPTKKKKSLAIADFLVVGHPDYKSLNKDLYTNNELGVFQKLKVQCCLCKSPLSFCSWLPQRQRKKSR